LKDKEIDVIDEAYMHNFQVQKGKH